MSEDRIDDLERLVSLLLVGRRVSYYGRHQPPDYERATETGVVISAHGPVLQIRPETDRLSVVHVKDIHEVKELT